MAAVVAVAGETMLASAVYSVTQHLTNSITGFFTNSSKADKDDRAKYIGQTYTQMEPQLAGKMLMIVYPKHDASGLMMNDGSKVVAQDLVVPRKSGDKLTYKVYVFDYGVFHQKGDGGFVNWIFTAPSQGFKREGQKLTWDKK